MIRKRILLASLLKPVSDPRLYEKIGKSLAKRPELEVHVAGFAVAVPPQEKIPNITLHPIFHFKRLSLGRLSAQRRFWQLLIRLKPAVVVVATHELLLLSNIYCRRFSAKLVYDVQENYFLNLSTQGVYRNGVSTLLARAVRGIEKAVAPDISHFFLAEASYAQELPFLGDRYSIVQNKYAPPEHQPLIRKALPVNLRGQAPLRLLYSGTISKLYGVLEAIAFINALRQWVPAELTIIGYCADAAFLQEVKARVAPFPFITLIGGDAVVPHHQILEQEQSHHIGLLPYRPHPSTFRCVPTKLFEYQANGLIVVAQENEIWGSILHNNSTGFFHDFSAPPTQAVVRQLLEQMFYPNGIPEDVFWNQEEALVQAVISDL